MIFQTTSEDTLTRARTGILNLNGIELKTPVFMPVGTRGVVKTLSADDLEELEYSLILGNTYHLYLRPGTSVLDRFGGLKKFSTWKKALLTDSGGYQVFSLNSLFKYEQDGVRFQSHIDGSRHYFTPNSVIDIQRSIGSDIMMVLDDCAPFDSGPERLKQSLDRTRRWAEMSVQYWEKNKNSQHLFGIFQGGIDLDFRLESLNAITSLPFDGIAIGGLSVGEPRKDFIRILNGIATYTDRNRPLYLMGVGTVPDILDGVKNGVDMFDCVLPTRNARNGQVFTTLGKINLRNEKWKNSDFPIDSNCTCKVCKRYSIGYIRHLHHVGEITAFSLSTYHNLHFMKNFLTEIQNSIQKGEFLEIYAKWKNLYEKPEFSG
ncbi:MULTISPECIES: tRNA guanosine(34) transglycosylase Tgt [Leptospira]|uniref:Queuine tRNA-ribosyltransferase n=1 Tax=Leptospira kirschneri serovar Pomona TaxID=561005 RepID=A0A1T1DI46_9LEPT|nr:MULTISPECIES: tRNA guanosine(34) transglycosylase Tgt [Leptospira]EMJ91292.1 tRNA-guanine transglycosylase [Leptospira kirschneri str. JB]EMK08198.1 tRNA-guanine transglycosylase [Leptospira kirschneri]KXZ29924.1 tRNA-guanine(34) transglycosylase [Leptospira kirschneri]KXZ32810.1 tRNA-guanine(34) transglycosylase [Leptospira sp. ZV016]OOV40507.1 tRNA guanosine(34) transglycosylase Tgt [Leptospira kirschneri serovar Pomona]